ncbi:forkhead box protein M1 isoform X2 [Loxodonta africana]|uniref:Forkhead box protein M1 n=1 Tax=Loxodonta africana TaxID=9785 RepID=G3SRA2_LOXAF|nr:forkhead box protein M1 isoform X2 [Loxodonta africana]XP_023404790.1 forkhead box protein M1 isoform X2 [Loxodonta africana]XP_049738133.1 forkhead box protein M1 isoform X2 [Elephas maximus indicus]
MKTSPRRPLILKRRRLPLPVQNAPGETSEEQPKQSPAQQEPGQAQASKEVAESSSCKFPAGIKIINHPTMPNTQVVAIPNNANIQSIITALTAKGKESGSSGPNKFILISCGGAPTHPPGPQPVTQASCDSKRTEVITETLGPKPTARDVNLPRPPGALPGQRWESCAGGEAAGCTLDNSLTNIQWLGKMSSDGLGSCGIKQEMEEKENHHLEQSQVKVEKAPGGSTSWQDSMSERPPYSYMAMIQFAINSTERKRMTLKDIYTWIEDHFPYFKHIAKPGWKNSIRHNLSLHDMFVRETSANGKVSFWTIHPSANRYLTLDQVFKPLDPGSPQSPEHLESQQKRPNPELRRNMTIKTELPLGARRKMKPLLPRVSSYLVPIQFPVNQSLVLQPSVKVPLPLAASLMSSELSRHSKRVRIAPKVLLADEGIAPLPTVGPVKEEKLLPGEGLSPLLPVQSIKEEEIQAGEETPYLARHIKVESPPLEEWPSPSFKEEPPHSWEDSSQSPTPRPKKSYSGLKSPARCVSEMLVIKRRERRERSRSRRKQHLLPPRVDEPEPLFSEGPSTSRRAAELPFLAEASEPASQHCYSQEEGGPFKTPIKETLPISSTPSKSVLPMTPESWRLTPPAKEGGLDFSPVRTPQGAFGPLPDSLGLMDLSTTPLKSVPLFDSPREFLNSEPFDLVSDPFSGCPPSDMETPKPGSPEPQVANLSANRSLTEGLVLDTMNDSLSKILLDISFPGLEEDPLGPDNTSWSQFIPELR